MPKFAANLSMMFTEVDFLDRFKAAADAGFSAVEYLFPYDYPADVLVSKLKENGLQQVLFNTTAGNVNAGEWGINAIPGREQEARASLDLALEYAIALNCPSIHVMAGVVPDTKHRAKYQQTFIDNVRYAADKFAPHGINVLIEALSPVVKPDYLIASQYHSAELVDLMDRTNVFIQLDTFHAQIVDGNLTRLIEQLNGRFAHVQIASLPDRHEPDEGEIDYNYIFNVFDRLGYQGWIGCEYKPRGKTEEGLGWLKPYL